MTMTMISDLDACEVVSDILNPENEEHKRYYFGTLWVSHKDPFNEVTGILYIADVRIAEEFRGQGIFTQLLALLEKQTDIRIEIVTNARLHPFFKQRGYKKVNESYHWNR